MPLNCLKFIRLVTWVEEKRYIEKNILYVSIYISTWKTNNKFWEWEISEGKWFHLGGNMFWKMWFLFSRRYISRIWNRSKNTIFVIILLWNLNLAITFSQKSNKLVRHDRNHMNNHINKYWSTRYIRHMVWYPVN